MAVCKPLRARSRGMICSSSMRRSSRGTPGVKKKRALPMSSAKPQAVPIGLSISSALAGSRACLRLLGGITRLRRRKNSSIRARHSSLRTRSTPAAWAATSWDRSSTVAPRPPLTITASARSPASWNARRRLSRSSPTVVSHPTESPTSSSFWLMSLKLVLTIFPVRTSSPVQMISMRMRRCLPVICRALPEKRQQRVHGRAGLLTGHEVADPGSFNRAFTRSLGGAELDLPTYVQVIEEIGKADASTGWIVNQCAIFATYAARMPPDVARSIWMDTPRSVVANTPAPTAQAVVVSGGYRVTGRQGFSTGCRHAAWLAAHAQIVANGQPRLKDGQSETRYLFVPVAEAELLDTWHVRGMRGTGTHHFAVSDVFVPEERTVLPATAPLVETGPLYRIPRTLLFASGDASVALAVGRSCLATVFELAGAKTPRATPALLRDQPLIQVDVGRAEAHLRSGLAFLTEAVRAIPTTMTSTRAISPDQH